MPAGRPRLLRSEKVARGTLRPSRERDIVEIQAPDQLPVMPSWLTPEGEAEWQDLLPRAASLASEVDSALLGALANLQGALAACWRAGEVPPTGALTEFRKLSEAFGLAGPRSRVLVKPAAGKDNPFSRNGRRRGTG
jgi:hypothetical protein